MALRGRQRLLAPLLVTGCKVWHLRDAGVFYPKHAWLRTIAALPIGAQASPALPCPALSFGCERVHHIEQRSDEVKVCAIQG